MIELTTEQKEAFIEGAKALKGHSRRVFMARIVKSLGRGGQVYAEREFGWDRKTIIKGRHELETGIECIDYYEARGRKKAEEKLPHLLEDMKSIVDSQSQTDPTFQSTRLYTRLTAREVHQRLLEEKGYTEEELPSIRVLSNKLNELGYHLRTVRKSQPKKKSQRPTPSSSSSKKNTRKPKSKRMS